MKCSLISLLMISEFFFSLGLEVLRTTTGFVFGHELSLNFADVIEQDESILFYLVTGGVASFILGLLSDLYLGKYYPTMFGLFMALASSGFGFVAFLTEIPMKLCLLGYMTTSQIRNSIIIEQLRLADESKELRTCIFYMVYMRLVGRGFFLILTQLNYATSSEMDVALGISCAVFLFYLIFFLAAGDFFYIESVYMNILCRIVSCVRNAVRNERELDLSTSYYELKQKKVKPVEIAEEPMPTRSGWCYSAITTESPEIKPETPSVEESPEESLSSDSTEQGYGKLLCNYLSWFFSYFWYKRRETVEVKTRMSMAVLPKSMSAPPDEKGIVYNIIAHEGAQTDKFFTLTSDKNREIPTYTFNDDDMENWLFHASPKSTNYIIHQTMKFQAFTRYIFLGFIYVWLCLFITLYTSHQEVIALKTDEWFVASTGLRIVSFSVIFELILFPVVELILVPAVCNYFQNSMAPIALGHFVLLLAGFAMLLIQIILVRTVPYIPESTTAQFRVYNSLLIKTSVYSVVTGYKEIHPLDFIFVSDIHATGKLSLHVTFEDGRNPLETNINIEANTSCSYLIRNDGIVKNTNDPTILFNEVFVSKLFVIMDLDNITATMLLEDYEDIGKEIQFTVRHNAVFDIEPSSYRLTVFQIERTLFSMSNHKFEKGTLSALVINSDPNYALGNMLHLEGPLVILFEHLLIHTLMKSLANVFATVTFYRNAYVESPEKMRSSLFGFMFMLNFLNYVALNTDTFFHHGTRGVHTTSAILFYSGHIVIFIISMFTLYKLK